MRQKGSGQALTYTLRLPDETQADALRLLEASRQVTNTTIEALWPRLDEFVDGRGRAYKQVSSMRVSPDPHGCRQWRCEAETAGRVLRAQAKRKAAFEQIGAILSESLIVPARSGRQRKDRRELMRRVRDLRESEGSDAGKLMMLVNVVEQACNFYLSHERFPASYEEMQAIPLLNTGMLTYAGDDGPSQGQAYRLRLDIPERTLWLKLRVPDENGEWAWWENEVAIGLPDVTLELLGSGQPLAPTLRAVTRPDGTQIAYLDFIVEKPVCEAPDWEATRNILAFDWGVHTLLTVVAVDREGQQLGRPVFLNTGGFDGKQARLRKQIDELKARRDRLDDDHPKRAKLQREIDLCWQAYARRNKAMAHLAANFLLVLAGLYNCDVIGGEWLASLKTTGRGRGKRGRWRNWRNNTTLRSEIWKVLKYKARLAGIHLRAEYPRGTSHTCPRCGEAAQTFKSPEHSKPIDWGRWLKCAECGWNGDRDYAAALNVGRLTIAFVNHSSAQKKRRGFRISDNTLKPVSYNGAGAARPFPPQCMKGIPSIHLFHEQTTHLVGWPLAVSVRQVARHPI